MCQHNYCFRVFWYVRLYAYPRVFWGGVKVVPVFEIMYLFFDLQVVVYGHMTSIISSILL